MYGRLCRVGVLALVFVGSVFVAPASAQSDAIIQGRVVASADGSALPGATVSLRPKSGGDLRSVVCDASGRFAFSQVIPGQYVLSFAMIGFDPRSTEISVAPREVRILTLKMDIARFAIVDEVRPDSRSIGSHSPSSTFLTAERIETMPALARTGLPDAIVTSAPGMIRGHDDFVHIRGHEIALNPIINGVTFWENTHAVFSAGISPDVIQTANVMTGGFPAEYGNRFGGVVDVATKSGLGMFERAMTTVSFGDAGRRLIASEIGHRRGGFGFYGFGSALWSDRFLSPPDPRAIHDATRAAHGFARFDGAGRRLGSVNVIVMADGIDSEIPKTATDDALRPLANPAQRTRQQTAISSWSHAGARTITNVSGYERWSRLRLSPADGPLTARAEMTRELLTIGAKTDFTRLVGRHTVKFGVDAVRLRPVENLTYDDTGYQDWSALIGPSQIHIADHAVAFSDRKAGGQVSAFAQDNLQLGGRMTADVGLRVDRYGLVVTETGISPRINVAFRPSNRTVLHGSYNHFFVPPAIEGVLSSSAGLTRFVEEVGVALPPLRATAEDQFEIGVATFRRSLRLALTAYHRSSDNPVHTTIWPDSRIYSYASFDRARAQGLEAKVDVQGFARRGFTAYLNYALGKVTFSNPVTGGFITDPDHLEATSSFAAPMDQRQTLTAGAIYRHAQSGLSIGVTGEYGSGTPIGHDDEGRVPAHFTADASVSFDALKSEDRPRLTFRLDVQNVTDNVYAIARDSEFSPAQYAIPRLISLTVRIRFY